MTERSAENDAALTEAERELLSSLCDVAAPSGPGYDAYCYAHHAPVKWAGRANADEVCCIQVEDYVEQVLELRATRPIPPADGCLCLFEDGAIVRTDDLCPLHSKRPGVRVLPPADDQGASDV